MQLSEVKKQSAPTLTFFINISNLSCTYILLVHIRGPQILVAQGSIWLLEVFCVVLLLYPHSVLIGCIIGQILGLVAI